MAKNSNVMTDLMQKYGVSGNTSSRSTAAQPSVQPAAKTGGNDLMSNLMEKYLGDGAQAEHDRKRKLVSDWQKRYNAALDGFGKAENQRNGGYAKDIGGGYASEIDALIRDFDSIKDIAGNYGMAGAKRYLYQLQDLQRYINETNSVMSQFGSEEAYNRYLTGRRGDNTPSASGNSTAPAASVPTGGQQRRTQEQVGADMTSVDNEISALQEQIRGLRQKQAGYGRSFTISKSEKERVKAEIEEAEAQLAELKQRKSALGAESDSFVADEYRAKIAALPEKDRKALEDFHGNYQAMAYGYLLRQGYDRKEIDAMWETMQRDKNAELSESAINGTYDWTGQNAGTAVAGFGGARAGNLAGAVTGTFQVINDLARHYLRGSPYSTTDPNSLGYLPSRMAGAADQAVSEAIEGEEGGIVRKGAAFVYRGAANAADNLARMAVATAIGGPAAGATVNSVFSFTQGFQGSYREAVERGGSPVQALLMGSIDGGMEVFTESRTFERWMNLKDPELISQGVYEWLKTAAIGIGNEITEEEASYIANTIADAVVMADKGENAEYIKQAVASGLTPNEAKWELAKKIAHDMAVTAGETAMSTLIMDGVTGSVENYRYKKTYGGSSAELVQEGLESPVGTQSRTLAEQYQEKLDAGKQLTGGELRNMVLANEEQIQAEEAAAEKEETEKQPEPEQQPEPPKTAAPSAAPTENDTTVTLESLSEKYGEYAGAMRGNYLEGQNAEEYDRAFQTAFDMGKSGLNKSALSRVEALKGLTDSQREIAYEIGEAAAAAQAKTQSGKNAEQANGKTGWHKGVVRGEGVKIADLTSSFNDPQRKAYSTLSTIAEATGIDIVLYKSEANSNGEFEGEQGRFRWEDNAIYIDVNAGLKYSKDVGNVAKYAMLRTYGHEFTHFIEKWNPEQYNDFRKAVFNTMENAEDLIETKLAQDKDGTMTYDQASREVVAEAMTDILEDSQFLQELAAKHTSVFDTMKAKLKEFVANLKSYFKSLAGNGSREAKQLKKEVGDSISYLEDIVKRFDAAAVQAVENYQKTVAEDEAETVSEKETVTDSDNSESETASESKEEPKQAENDSTQEDSVLNNRTEEQAEAAPAETNEETTEAPTPTAYQGFSITPNTERGTLEITFDSKPPEGVRDALKANKFRWSSKNKLWYGRGDQGRIAEIIDNAMNDRGAASAAGIREKLADESSADEALKQAEKAAKAEEANENESKVQYQNRPTGNSYPNVRDMDIDRTYLAYSDNRNRNETETRVANDLISRGKVTVIDEITASKFIKATDWSNFADARNCIRAILKSFAGKNVYFSNKGKNGVAYLTGKGIDHAVAGRNTEQKAISLENFKSLIKNAEYAYSGKNDHGSISGNVDWDYFVSVAKIGDNTLPFVFAVRTIDDDYRSQIYSIATKENPAIPRGDAKQNENSAIVHPSYGDSPSSNPTIADDTPGVNTAIAQEAILPETLNDSGKVQNQQRDDRLTDRGVLYMAAHNMENMKLTEAQSDALRIFNERIGKLDKLNSQRSELESQLARQAGEQAEETRKTLSRVKRQITEAKKDVFNAETAPILQKLLPKARTVVEESQKKRDKALWDKRQESRKRTEIRNKILDKADDFRKMALAPRQANSLHAPVSLMNALADFCMIFEDSEERGIERRRTELSQRAQKNAARADGLKIKEAEQAVIERMEADLNKKLSAIQSLKNEYSEIKEHPEYGLYHDEQVQKWVDQLSDQLMDTDIREMTSEQLADVYKTMQAMEHAIVNANKAISAGKDKTFTGMLINLRSQIGNVNMRYGTVMNFAKRHFQWHMTPDVFWNYVCGFSKGNEGKTVQGMFQHGTERMLTVQRDFANAFRGFTETDNRETAKAIRDMMKAPMKNKVKWGLKNLAGEEIETSRGMMLQAYMLLKQKDSFDSIVYGGFKLPNEKAYYKGKTDAAYSDAEREVLYGEAITDDYRSLSDQIQDGLKPVKAIDKKIAEIRKTAKTAQEKRAVQQLIDELKRQKQEAMKPVEELQKKAQKLVEGEEARLLEVRAAIESQLTDVDKALIAAADQWYQHSGELLSEVFENMYGFRPALVEGYTPIHRDLDTVTLDIRNDTEKAFNLENAGMTKERVDSKKPILLTDFFQELANHTNQISRYYGFAQVQKDFNRLWNMRMPGTGNHTLKAMISEKYGAGKTLFGVSGEMYVENYIKSVAGSTYTDDIFSVFYGNSASATLSANPRVALSQLASIPTASAVVGWQSMAAGFAKGISTSFSTAKKNQLANESVWFYNRYRGAGGSTELADLKMQGTLWEKVRDSAVGKALFNWCQEMDVFATASMWAMAEDYTERNGTPRNAEDFKEKTAQCYADIIRRTQPNYTATERSDLLRDQKAGMKLLTMYKTQSNQNLNILMNSVGEYRAAVLDFKKKRNGVTKEDIHNAKVSMINGITAVSFGGTVAFVLLRTLVNFALGKIKPYEDDETGEVTLVSLFGAMGKEALGSFAGMFALGSLAFDFLYSSVTGDKYYGVSDMALSGISDTLTDFNKLIQRAFDEDKDVRWEDVEKTLGSLLTLGGIPYKNVKTILAASNTWYQKLTGTFENTEELTQKQAVGRLLQAVKDGDSAKANDMIAYLAASSEASTDYETERDVSSTVKTKIGDAYKAGKCNETEADGVLRGYTVYSTEEIQAFIANWNGEIETGLTYLKAKEAYVDGSVDQAFILDYMKKYQLLDDSSAEKTELHLRRERETGIVFAHLRDMVGKGQISEKEAAAILTNYDGKSQADAEFAVKKWRFVYENPEYAGYSDAAIGKYFNSGVPQNVFFKAYTAISAMEADKDANGKSISGSKKEKIVRYIQNLPGLSYSQKKAMWNSVKGSMNDKGTPWE